MKKWLIVFSIALTICVISFSMNTDAAGNTGDTTWTNQYRVFSPDDHSPARKKMNKSAYYNYIKKCSTGHINIWAALYDGRDVSDGHDYKVRKGDKTKLYNKAVEKYGKGVSVRIDSRRYEDGSASGVWSPDSKK